MTGVELDRAAAAIVPPVGAGGLCLVTNEQQRHRVAFVVNGRGKAAVGPSFTKPREAARFMDLLGGVTPTPRSGQTTAPVDMSGSSSAGQSGAPEQSLTPAGANGVGSTPRAGASGERTPESGASISRPVVAGQVLGSAAVPPVICAGCGEPVPPGRHGQRRLTHGPACRQAARRRRDARATRADADGGTPVVTPSRAVSTDPPQGEAVGVSSSARRLLRGAAHPASGVSRARGADRSLGLFAEG